MSNSLSKMSVEQAKSLIQAAERGELKKVEHCLKTLSINATDDQSQTALHFAAANGHERVVRHLIKKGKTIITLLKNKIKNNIVKKLLDFFLILRNVTKNKYSQICSSSCNMLQKSIFLKKVLLY